MNKWLAMVWWSWMAGVAPVALVAAPGVFPSGDAAWTVEVDWSRPPGANSGAPLPVKYDIQKKGPNRRDIITFSNGRTTERWWYVGSATFLFERGLNGVEYFLTPNEKTAATAFDSSTFRWLDGKKPIGEEKWKGRNCVVFGGEIQGELRAESRKAWIDKETGFVRGLQADGATYVFTFHEEIPERLDPPPTLLRRADRALRIIGGN